MKKQFQIILADKATSDGLRDVSRRGRISRIKLTLLAFLVAVLALGMLAVALVVGSIIAAVLCSVFILVGVIAFISATFRRR